VLSIGGDGVRVSKRTPEKEPGYTIDTFTKSTQDDFLKSYRQKYPEAKRELRAASEERYRPPQGYSDLEAHLANFIEAVRTRKPVVEDPSFGLRAAGPALLCNVSRREKRPITWDPEAMRVTS
jgi:hypothetical protein